MGCQELCEDCWGQVKKLCKGCKDNCGKLCCCLDRACCGLKRSCLGKDALGCKDTCLADLFPGCDDDEHKSGDIENPPSENPHYGNSFRRRRCLTQLKQLI